jgi:membrane protease YdiL (CAAX protease family)
VTSALSPALARPAALVAGLAGALLLRVGLAGAGGPTSVSAGLAFACALMALSVAAGWRPGSLRPRRLGVGLAGAAVVCAPALARAVAEGALPPEPWEDFAMWAPAVAAVAVAEEVLCRGALYEAVREAGGDYAAIAAGALVFAAMHVVLNGGRAFALDLAVGAWLGVLRMATGGVAAPATTHVVADLAAWWLR